MIMEGKNRDNVFNLDNRHNLDNNYRDTLSLIFIWSTSKMKSNIYDNGYPKIKVG